MIGKQVQLPSKEKCSLCNEPMNPKYFPMKDWGIKGPMCVKCYSKKIAEYYPGEHAR